MLAAGHRPIAILALSVALASNGSLASAQQPAQPPPEAAPVPATREDLALARARLAERIVSLLGELAVSAEQVPDPDLRLSCQLEAAALLWPRDPDQARQIYRDAFDALTPAAFSSAGERAGAVKRLSSLLAHVARRDPALAESFTQRMSLLLAADEARDAARSDSRAELLVNAALEMLPGDPARAEALGRLALTDGVTPSVMRLLIVLRGVDAARADQLFAAALGAMLQSPNPSLNDVGTLAFYLVAIGGSRPEGVPADAMRVYLDIALRLIAQTPSGSAEASSAYFIGRQLSGFYARYLPERAPELEARVALLSQSDSLLRAERASQTRATDPDSPDARHAQAATSALARDDYAAAHAEAAAIEDSALRARVYAQGALRLLKLRRFDEATREIARVPDPGRRASLLVQLAGAAHARGDLVRAVQALTDAEREAGRATGASQRIQALFSIVSAFADIDPIRAFGTLQAAVDSVNRAARAEDKALPLSKVPSPRSLNFNATFARLARIDFDGAWLLARQLDGRAPRLLAQLAVCRGGLSAAGASSAGDEDPEDADAPEPSL